MTKRIALSLPLLALVASCQMVLAQSKAPPQRKAAKPTQAPATDTQKKNIQEYIELLRANVREEKSQIMGAMMLLDKSEAAKFWPIYEEYDGELSTLNNLRSENIQDYARTYSQMTDQKADELITKALDYQKQRLDLLGKYYERVKQSLGAISAARFLQIEHQLLLIIDLQIASSLPVVGQG
ncbi:MAG TPA: hypothetical protein VNS63_21175 [Blastocatellia bacterium]|nr:hypothetical protein [Blastocatellia bacterium]